MSKPNDLDKLNPLTDWLESDELDNKFTKERVYNRIIHKMDNGQIGSSKFNKDGRMEMNKRKMSTGIATAALAVGLIGGFSATTYAQDLYHQIMAQFHIGNMQITQYEGEVPVQDLASSGDKNEASSGNNGGTREETAEVVKLGLQEARAAVGLNFPAPTWLDGYEYANTVVQGDSMVELQYAKGEQFLSLLISKGGENGISTADEVKKQEIAGTEVYFANGIVFWVSHGFTVELYSAVDFDTASLEKIISGMKTGDPVAPLTEEGKTKLSELQHTGRAAEVAGPAPAN